MEQRFRNDGSFTTLWFVTQAQFEAAVLAETLVLIPGQRFSPEERPEAVVLLVIDTEQRAKVSGDTLVRLYNLTPSETRVALMLIDGKRLDQIAEELEVAQTTVVFHLKNLFRKTDTNRQADLVRVLLSVPLRTSAD